jgi:hypothetical protein
MRAAYVQENLASIGAFDDDDRSAVLADLGEDMTRQIRDAERSAWLDLALDVRLTEAIHGVAGDDGLRAANRDAIQSSFDGAVFGSLFSAAVQLFGPTPYSLLRWAPRAFENIYRDAGYWRVDRQAERSATIVWGRIPDMVLACAPYLEGVCGALEGAARAVKHTSTVELTVDEGLRAATFVASWVRD